MMGVRGIDSESIRPQEPDLSAGQALPFHVHDFCKTVHPLKHANSAVLGPLLAMSLGGCALLGSGPAPLDTFELTAPSVDQSRRSNAQILIVEPSALKALDGENIVIKTGPGAIQFLKGAQWADRLPKMVQAKLAEAFQKAGGFAGVGRPGEGLAIDYQIAGEIRQFEVRADRGSQARVQIFIRILNDRNGTVRASKVFDATAAVGGVGNEAYIAALDRAFGKATVAIVAWTDSII